MNQSKLPALRFPEFIESWQEKKIEEIASVNTGNKDTQDRVDGGAYPFYVRSDNVERINSFAYDGEAILTSGDGVGVGRNFHYIVGKFNYHQRVYCIHNFDKSISGKYFYYYFSTVFYSHVIRLSAKNSVDSVRRSMITELEIPIPSLPEQQKIASFLTAVDAKIELLTKKKALLEQYKKGVMQQLFSQKIRFKDDEDNEFQEWETVMLEEAAVINPKSNKLPDSFVYIDLESVENGALVKEEIIKAENAPSRAQRIVQNDDILFQTVRPYQKNNLLFNKGGSYVASTGYAQIRTNNNPKYIYYYLHTDEFVDAVMMRCTGTGYPAINSNDLAKIKISIPSLSEQNKITLFLSAVDEKIDNVNAQMIKTFNWKKGLLGKIFSQR